MSCSSLQHEYTILWNFTASEQDTKKEKNINYSFIIMESANPCLTEIQNIQNDEQIKTGNMI